MDTDNFESQTAEEMQIDEVKETVSDVSMDDSDEDTVSFEDLGLDDFTLKAVEKKGFVTPSPIQILAIPRLLNGDTNLIARARTGTGKTAAFGLPIIQNIRNKSDHVEALVLEPTRELAMQTCAEMQSFSTNNVPRTTVLYGGASYAQQIRELKQGCEIVVGTPGRIKDHIERKTLDLSKIKYFILDEGDEMLDMGFIDDIREIFEHSNAEARILLFSATMPSPILKIAGDFMGEYDIIEEEKVVDEALLIDQKYWMVKESDKVEALVRLIDLSPDFYGLVFTMTKMDADNVTRALDLRGYEAAALHGDIMQNQREKVLERFRSKKTRILVATDVAARGIDISGLSHVVNYSLPFDTATYVHRIGRTGRAGTTGIAVTFVRPEERKKLSYFVKNVERATKSKIAAEKIPTVNEVLSIKEDRIIDELKEKLFIKKSVPLSESIDDSQDGLLITEDLSPENTSSEITDDTQETKTIKLINQELLVPKFEKLAEELLEEQDPDKVIAALLSIMYGEKLSPKHYGKISTKEFGLSGDQMRIFVSLGKKDGYRAKEIAKYFSELLHIPGRMVDDIDVAQQFSLVSLPTASAKKALDMAKHNSKLPHMHIDSKEEGRGTRKGGRGSEFNDRDRSRGDRSSSGNKKENRGEGRGDRRNRDKRNDRHFEDNNKKSKAPGTNPHHQTERNSSRKNGGAAAFVKKGKKAERF